MTISIDQANLIVSELIRLHPDTTSFKSSYVGEVGVTVGIPHSKGYKFATEQTKVKRGLYDFTNVFKAAANGGIASVVVENLAAVTPITDAKHTETKTKVSAAVASIINDDTYIPEKLSTYVKWGSFTDVRAIIKSRQFMPIFITGLSGNGKTIMVEQACSELKRPMIRVQISPETDEDALIGGFRMIAGETVFAKGPVVKAMETGAVLLIDEIDRGTNKIMALQGVMEGKPILINKTGEVIYPAPGFTVIATGNTKGRGSEDGRFASNIIDDAFLERFPMTVEQPYPTPAIELKIVLNHMEKFNALDRDFAKKLVDWSQTIRKTFEDDGVDELISTRRLCHITQVFSVFDDKMKSIELCINRFDSEVKDAFLELYSKVDLDVAPETSTEETQTEDANALPF